MKYFRKIFFVSVLLVLPLVASAQLPTPSGSSSGIPVPSGTGSGIPVPSGSSAPCNTLLTFCNPLSQDTICGALKLFLQALLTLGIPIAVLFIVYAGFLFVWARGSAKGLQHAKTNLLYTILGIAIFMGAWLLGQIVANTFSALANSSGQPNSQIGACR
jgi:hypothetical protein